MVSRVDLAGEYITNLPNLNLLPRLTCVTFYGGSTANAWKYLLFSRHCALERRIKKKGDDNTQIY